MKHILVLALTLLSSVSFASERYLGKVTVKDGAVGMPMQSCDGPRDQVVGSITLEVRDEALDLKRVSVRMEDSAGRSDMVSVAVRAGNYQVGSRIHLNLPRKARCVQNVLIVGNSQGARALSMRRTGRRGTRHTRILRYIKPSVVLVYGDLKIR